MSFCHPAKLIQDELNHIDEVVDRAKRACQDLSVAEADSSHHGANLPIKQTFLEAFATIQRREEDRRKNNKQEAKSKQQKKSASDTNPQFRGTKIGVDPEVSAFWMVMEDYCRAVQPGDLQLLLPQHESLAEDTAFYMPPLGFNPTQDESQDTDDGHDATTPAETALDPGSAPTGLAPVKADPVDSTMHEVTAGSAQGVAWEQHNDGPSILHGGPRASTVNALQVTGSLVPASEGDNSWQQLASAAAAEERNVLEPELVERIRSCILEADSSDAHIRNPCSDLLQVYAQVMGCQDKYSCVDGSLADAEPAREEVRHMLLSSADMSLKRGLEVLPPIDAATAVVSADDAVKMDSDAVAAPAQYTETVAADEVVHPYLQTHLQCAVLLEPALQQGRKSPSLAAAPGTPITDHQDPEQPRAAAPAGPCTPNTNGIEPASECAHACEDKGMDQEAGQENAAEGGNDAADVAHPGQLGAQEASVDCSSMAHSMDCSADVKEAPISMATPVENTSAPQAVQQQQRRSGRKRKVQERDGDSKSRPPAKRAGTPHAATSTRESPLSRHSSAKPSEARDTPGEDVPASTEPEPAVKPKPTRGGRGKGGTKASKAAAAVVSGDSEGVRLKAEPKTSTATPGAEKESGAPNGAAAGAAHGAQDHDNTLLTCCAEEQWASVNLGADVLAVAPDDEVVAEIISLQAELLQVAAANRKRCAKVLNAVVSDLPARTEKLARQAKSEEEMESFLVHIRALKRQAKLEKREAERKEAAEALAAAEAAEGSAAGGSAAAVVTGRVRRTAAKHAHIAHASEEEDDDEESEDEIGGVPLPLAGASLVDPYALEVPDAINALCAVCGDGESKGNDQIVFCDRCNVAVHQNCYGVGEIPQGDWLCWPCRMYEDELKGEGKQQDDIRPPRFKESGNPDYPGGSKTASCELCPMKRGIFKQTVADADGQKKWAHVVCALWQTPDVTVAAVNRADVISKLDNIRDDHLRMTCLYCRQRIGATVKCAHNKCHNHFHPLCARRVGCFSLCHHSTGRGRPTYKTWCAQHSDAARRRERDAPMKTAAPVNGEKRVTGGPKQPQAPADVPVSKEDLAALEAELSAKNEALQFLRGVRYDLESARILAAQVEKREKSKMHVVDLLKQEYEMVLENPAEFAKYEGFLGCRRFHHDLVEMMQSTFDAKRMKARKVLMHQHELKRQHYFLQQQQAQRERQVQQQRMHQVDAMPGAHVSAPGMPPGHMMYGQSRPHSGAAVHTMRMSGQDQGQTERMSQPQQYGMQQNAMMGGHGGYAGGMMGTGADEGLLRGLTYDQSNNSPLVSPSSMLDPVAAQGGAHMMAHDGRFPQSHAMQGVSRMPMDRGGMGALGGGSGMGSWHPGIGQHSSHPLGGYAPRELPADHGMRGMRNAGGAVQDMLPMNSSSFGLRASEMNLQHNPQDHNMGRMPLSGAERGMGQLHDPTIMHGGSHLHGGISHLGNGQQYRVQQMHTSDPAGFGGQSQSQDGMSYMPQHPLDLGVQQTQAAGASQHIGTAAQAQRPGRSQRAAAQAARGRSFAAAADPFTFMDDQIS